jgi:uncharacterized Zn-binding protein involved in type VI secretion
MALSAAICNFDSCGGVIRHGNTQSKAKHLGNFLAVVGDPVDSHIPHGSSNMSSGSAKLTIQGFAACRFGDSALCGHTVSTSTGRIEINS